MHDQLTHHPQRYHGNQTAQSAIATAGMIGLYASIPFWIYIQWLLLAPGAPDPATGQAPSWAAYLGWGVLAALIGLVTAVALPASFALAAPSNAAGQYLQKSQVKTVGFWVHVVTTALFCVYAFGVLYATWEARMRPQGYSERFIIIQALFLCGLFIVLPASSWALATPQQWGAQIEAWMAIERLKLAHYYELAMAQAQFAQALDVFLNRLFSATPTELQFAFDTFARILGGRNQAIDNATRLIGAMQGVPLGSHAHALAEARAVVPEALTAIRRFIVEAGDPQLAQGIAAGEREYAQRTGAAVQPAPVPTPNAQARLEIAPAAPVTSAQTGPAHPAAQAPAAGAPVARPADPRAAQQRQRDAEEFVLVARAIGPGKLFTSAQVAQVLALGRSAIHNRMTRWIAYGWIAAVTSPHDHYQFQIAVDAAMTPDQLR
jgi:hypothetical protein